ncbi:MAG: RNA methyltransferase [Clostridiales bacterium]|nr:RNA methyltransferase [Clostridiales bacterium]
MITSKDNKLIKYIDKIKNKKYSKQDGVCFVESIKIIRELYAKGLINCILLSEEKSYLKSEFEDIQIEIVSSSMAKLISETMTTDGVFAIAKIVASENVGYSKCLILDNIQDPSNLGAIIRSACAFGYTTIMSLNSCYPYTNKVIRSSMGYVFDVNFVDVDLNKLIDLKNSHNILLITADMDGVSIDKTSKPDGNFAIVIGNEGNGVSKEVLELSDKVVSIPMVNGVESLNASVSASIIMFNLK